MIAEGDAGDGARRSAGDRGLSRHGAAHDATPLLDIAELERRLWRRAGAVRRRARPSRAGEIVALVGSNGAGKTTLLRAVSRVIPASGTLAFVGEDSCR